MRAAVLQRLTVERDGMQAEENRTNARKAELEMRLRQIAQDLEREREITADNDGVLQRLADEETELSAAGASDADARAQAEEQVGQAAQTLRDAEQEADEAAASLSALQTRKAGLEGTIADLNARLTRLDTELGSVREESQRLGADQGLVTAIDGAKSDLGLAQETLQAAEQAVETAEADHEAKREAEAAARNASDQARRDAERLRTEVATLEKVLSVPDDGQWPPVIDAVTVTGGYEAALGAALGDDLDVPADEAAPVHWRTLDALATPPALPAGAQPLADYVTAPAALARRLTQVGVVDQARGTELQTQLGPGQRLVSTEGDLWRWDGFAAAADAPTAAAQRLAERNRLDGLRIEAQDAAARAEAAREAFEAAQSSTKQISERLANNRGAVRQANQAVSQARDTLAGKERASAETNARTAALTESERRIVGDMEQVRTSLEQAETELNQIPAADALSDSLQRMRDKVADERAAYTEIKARFDGFERDAKMRAERLTALAEERKSWSDRKERATTQISALEQRAQETSGELEQMADLPKLMAERREKLFRALAEAEQERKDAADELAEAETRLSQCASAAKEADADLSMCRETHARNEERLNAARERHDEITKRIAERLECEPPKLRELAELKEDAELPDPEAIDARLSRLRAERERLGGVNLRADEEAQEVGEQLDTLVNEREDLIKAIHRLRQGISSLNKEGRERLVAAFDQVNAHFGELFTSLFGGGKASLEFVESDDPLEAGLEITARPPGKRTQVLSLLSGGEQALTAMALIFAVFLTNPSPICVLDECDAPLDDSNVERFCNLLAEMLKKSDTRFLIITHHAYTMSRMNRLFGVTMAERGVSQLVSVDLETAESYREAS